MQRGTLVAAKSDDPELKKPESVRQLLSEWFTTRHTTTIVFREETNPTPDPDARYRVAYEAIFDSSRLDQACVEIWVTTEGEIAIGFERRKRIAERLGVKSAIDRFAAGHEPHRMSEPGLLAILDLIADGQIAVSPTVIPLFGLVSTKAVVLHDVLEELALKGYSPVNWLKGVTRTEFSEERRFVKFRRWNHERA